VTLLSEALAEARAAAAPEVKRQARAVRPAASDEAMRLALSLRETRVGTDGRMLLFVPASNSVDASHATADAASGLLELRDGPIAILDLRTAEESAVTPDWIAALPADDQSEDVWGGETNDTAVVVRPFAGRRDHVAYAASPEFVSRLGRLRARYSYILCIGGRIPASVETLMLAATADGVILSVPPNQMTRSDMQRAVEQLRRARGHLIGFVVDDRTGPDND
jgi:hypothetical protein